MTIKFTYERLKFSEFQCVKNNFQPGLCLRPRGNGGGSGGDGGGGGNDGGVG